MALDEMTLGRMIKVLILEVNEDMRRIKVKSDSPQSRGEGNCSPLPPQTLQNRFSDLAFYIY
jgi:hypothetical protein